MYNERELASKVELNNGTADETYGVRTLASECGLADDAVVEYVRNESRWAGTGYVDRIYRVVGTDDAVKVHEAAGCMENILFENASFHKGYFAEQKSYAQQCGALSRKYKVPFDVALALGTNEDVYVSFVKIDRKAISKKLRHELTCGISRRKDALYEVLGAELYRALKIEWMGQRNSERIAWYFVG